MMGREMNTECPAPLFCRAAKSWGLPKCAPVSVCRVINKTLPPTLEPVSQPLSIASSGAMKMICAVCAESSWINRAVKSAKMPEVLCSCANMPNRKMPPNG